MLEFYLSYGLKGALLGAGLGLIGLPIAQFLVRINDNPAIPRVRTNIVVNSVFGFGFVFFSILAVLPYQFDHILSKTIQHSFAFTFLAIAVTSAICLYDAILRKIEWFDEGFRLQRWNSDDEFYTWQQIEFIDWDKIMNAWRIHLDDGDMFTFHPMMTGASRFLEHAVEKAQLFTQNKHQRLDD